MKSPVGIGFLSFAHGHVQAYAEVMKHFDDARLVIGYDDKPERGKPLCENAGMRYTPHIEDVLHHPDVQAVIIGGETSRHEELAVAAAQAGKHILLQKPLAFSMEACDTIIAAVNKAGIHFAMAFQMRHDPANIRIREIVHSGMLGDIAVIRRRHCIGVLLMDSFVNGLTRWHIEADKNKGMFMDDAVHPADWFNWIFGKPVSVMAEIDNIITNIAPDDNGYAIYRFRHGEMGTIFNSSVVMAAEGTTEIYGSKGVLIQNYGDGPACGVPRCPDGPALKVFRYGENDWDIQDVPIPPGGQGDRIRNVPRPWLDSLIAETPPPATAEDGRIATEMILGAYQSSESGKRVTFPLS
ncbi:MAG TPA: Gfo/Idh/MocA family oxidoreductase [Candidatus Hydrogenedentes bacterium]|nr:Gfo/Idh/MocA family oxidoreductase [Candidatus Hydrogenedentota bacterium]